MKKLVAYFSAGGRTAGKAKELAKLVGADLQEIVPAQAYTKADLDWLDKKSRSSLEMKDDYSRPKLVEDHVKPFEYDVVYIGFPIWWHTAPHVILSYLDSHSFGDAQIVLFATSGGSGIDKAVQDLKGKYPELHIVKGTMLNGSVSGDIL